MTLNQAFVFLGTNIDRKKNYIAALARLAKLGEITAASTVYETAPLGGEGRDFYNGAVLLDTPLSARELKHALRAIEEQLGRVRTRDRYSPRTIDLDLVLYNRELIDEPALHIPDPMILERPFLALTLAELAPEYVHPADGRTLMQIARSLDTSSRGMRPEPVMTAQAKELIDRVYSGESSHA